MILMFTDYIFKHHHILYDRLDYCDALVSSFERCFSCKMILKAYLREMPGKAEVTVSFGCLFSLQWQEQHWYRVPGPRFAYCPHHLSSGNLKKVSDLYIKVGGLFLEKGRINAKALGWGPLRKQQPM